MYSDLKTPLTRRQATHLLRRACANVDPDRIADAQGKTAREVAEAWIAEPLSTALYPSPSWLYTLYPPQGASAEDVAAFNESNTYYVQEVRERFLRDMMAGGLRARMTLFWHNHFVTDVRKYRYGTLAYKYLQRLTLGAVGDFKALARGFVRDGAMLYYLDGRFNRKNAPNENFARELLELFTMGPVGQDGQPNYSQDDIVEAARAFTGWTMNVRSSWESALASYNHDGGQKTIFGQTGNFNYNDVIDLIFEERAEQVASFVAGKLLAEFVYASPAQDQVDWLAGRMLEHDFQIGPTLADLFASDLFFDPQCEGARIKSPMEYMLLDVSAFKGNPAQDKFVNIYAGLRNLGQDLLSPPNVAGWPGHHSWLSTDTLPLRWNSVDANFSADSTLNSSVLGVDYSAIVEKYCDASSSHPVISLALNLAETLFATPLDLVEIPEVDQPFAGDLFAQPLPQDFLDGPVAHINLVKLFLGTVPWYEWNPSSQHASIMIRNYIVTLSKYPEYQLA
jgi:uncharacterized protein (DUF1800 family)